MMLFPLLLYTCKVVDWIIGPGEKLLASQKDIGNNYATADQYRREHEKLELKCTVSLHLSNISWDTQKFSTISETIHKFRHNVLLCILTIVHCCFNLY